MRERFVIKLIGSPAGVPVPLGDLYVGDMDFDAHDGRGELTIVGDPASAMIFHDHGAAFEFWRTQSTVSPLRPDNKPNRPLTAWSIEIVKLRAN